MTPDQIRQHLDANEAELIGLASDLKPPECEWMRSESQGGTCQLSAKWLLMLPCGHDIALCNGHRSCSVGRLTKCRTVMCDRCPFVGFADADVRWERL